MSSKALSPVSPWLPRPPVGSRDPRRPAGAGISLWIAGLTLLASLGFLDGNQQSVQGTSHLSVVGTASLDAAHFMASEGPWEGRPLRNELRSLAPGEAGLGLEHRPVVSVLTLLQIGTPGPVAGRSRILDETLVDLSIAVHPDRIHAPPSHS